MEDLISRSALLSEYDRVHVGEPGGARKLIAEAPAVDAVPVRHGEWSYKWDAERDPKRLFVRIVCSECNLHTGQKSNYCPSCGAKMDGGKNSEEDTDIDPAHGG